MGWKPTSHKKHHDKREHDKHPPSMMRQPEDGIFVKMCGTDKEIINTTVMVKK